MVQTTTASPLNLRFLIVWHALGVALLLLFPLMEAGPSLWSWTKYELASLATLIAGYMGSAAFLTFRHIRGKSISLTLIISTTLAIFSLAFLLQLLPNTTTDLRNVRLFAITVALISMSVSFGLHRFRTLATTVLAATVSAILILSVVNLYRTQQLKPSLSSFDGRTAFYNVRIKEYGGKIAIPTKSGGGISRLDDRYVLATGDGALYSFHWDDQVDDLNVEALPYRVPLNSDAFASAVGDTNELSYFRVSDVLVQNVDDVFRLYSAHHFWDEADECYAMRVSMLEGTRESFYNTPASLEWQTVYETEPCLTIRPGSRYPFGGIHNGGRLALLDENTLLFSVGNHYFDGLNREQILAQEKDNSYGKTMMIHLDDGTSEVFSLGHRNPQGLYVDENQSVWLTEHGPRGGDELNLVLQDANYGWPFATLGTDTTSFAWPLNPKQGWHDGYEYPTYAWVPSIGVSNLIRIENQDAFPLWEGDLLVASLRRQSLWRVRLQDGRVVFVEPIEIGHRIRDVIQAKDGKIILWTDDAAIITVQPSAETRGDGKLLYARWCMGCHGTEDATSHAIGPNLRGIVGREFAAAEGYSYSPGLQALDEEWTQERLDAFLANPNLTVPGTSMLFEGISDPAPRAAIVEYLATLK